MIKTPCQWTVLGRFPRPSLCAVPAPAPHLNTHACHGHAGALPLRQPYTTSLPPCRQQRTQAASWNMLQGCGALLLMRITAAACASGPHLLQCICQPDGRLPSNCIQCQLRLAKEALRLQLCLQATAGTNMWKRDHTGRGGHTYCCAAGSQQARHLL